MIDKLNQIKELIGDLKPLPKDVSAKAETFLMALETLVQNTTQNEIDDFEDALDTFKSQLDTQNDRIQDRRTTDTQVRLYEESIKLLGNKIVGTISKLEDMFFGLDTLGISNDLSEAWEYVPFESLLTGTSPMGETINSRRYEVDNKKFDDYLAYRFYGSTDFYATGICFQLNEFKSDESQFSITIKILVELTKYEYCLHHVVEPKNNTQNLTINEIIKRKPDLNRFYHQPLNELEIDSYCTKIGKEILEMAEKLYKTKSKS